MSTLFLKTTTSLCLAFSLVQPLPGVAWAQSPAPDCVPGTKDCAVIPPKTRGDKAPADAHAARPRDGAGRGGAPARQIQRQQPQRVTPPPAPVPQNRIQPPIQHQIRPAPPAPPVATTPAPPVATPRTNAPATPRTRTRTRTQPTAPSPSPVQPRQPPLVAPPTTRQQIQRQIQQQIQRPAVPPQAPRRPPLAAQTPQAGFTASGESRSIRIAPADVRPSRENRFVPRSRNGLSDLEKFGLIVLGAAVVGGVLSNGQTVILNSGDRVVARDHHGRYQVYHDDNVLLRRPGTHLTTERYHDGSVLSRILYPSGIVIYTVSAFDGRMLRRWVQYPDRPTVVLFDDTRVLPPPVLSRLPPRSPVNIVYTDQPNPDLLRTALMARPLQPAGRFFNLDQIRSIPEVRYLAPEIEIATLNFASGSAAVSPDQAQTLAVLAQVMDDMIARNPAELFLIEGHSDAVGDPVMNLALSDARAEATAAAMTEYFGVPPQNMVTQGYGESDRKQQTQRPNEANRRIILRRITELLPPAAE